MDVLEVLKVVSQAGKEHSALVSCTEVLILTFLRFAYFNGYTATITVHCGTMDCNVRSRNTARNTGLCPLPGIISGNNISAQNLRLLSEGCSSCVHAVDFYMIVRKY